MSLVCHESSVRNAYLWLLVRSHQYEETISPFACGAAFSLPILGIPATSGLAIGLVAGLAKS
jgi:hypothetical protein